MTRKNKYSNWREDLREVVDVEPKTDTESEKKITEKKIKNKIVINPPMREAFEEIGGTILEVVELDEVLDMKNADMGEVIKDFRKSDAPQFKGKSKEKRREMAIAAKLSAEEGFVPPYKELKTVSDEKAKKKERERRMSEGHMDGAPSIKDAKPVKKTDVKYDPHMKVMAPTVKKEETEDSLRDRRQERGGVDGNKRYDRKSPFVTNTKKHGVPGAKTPAQVEMEKKYGKGATAMDVVKAQIRAKYGKGAIMDPKKK